MLSLLTDGTASSQPIEWDDLDADNFMFFEGDGTTMTEDQAWMVRRDPLLYPAQG